MSELQEIQVTITPDGQVQIKVKGVKGDGCLALTRDIERYLGGKVVDRQKTDEFHATARTATTQKTGRGR